MRRKLPTLAMLFLAVAVLSAGSCEAWNLREAQDRFSAAARIENEIRGRGLTEFLEKPGNGLHEYSEAMLQYKMALQVVSKSIEKEGSSLRGEQLLGTAYILKALCLWRLADLDGGEGAHQKVRDLVGLIKTKYDNKQIILGTRDRTLLYALPGLIDHDQGLLSDTYASQSDFFRSAHDVLEMSLTKAKPPANHPIRPYIRIAQLSVIRSWQVALYASAMAAGPRNVIAKKLGGMVNKIIVVLRPRWEEEDELKEAIEAILLSLGMSWPEDEDP